MKFAWQSGVEQWSAVIEAGGALRWVLDVDPMDDERGNGMHTESLQTFAQFLAAGPVERAPLPVLEAMLAHLGGGQVAWLPALRLQQAVIAGDLPATSDLLGAGASPDLVVLRVTAMFLALQGDHLEIAGALLAAGVDVNVPSAGGAIALHAAVERARTDAWAPLLQRLIAAGSPIEARDGQGHTPLVWGLRSRLSPACVDVLLAAGAEVNAASVHGYTPLMVEAQSARRPEIARRLLDRGADVNAVDRDGWSSLTWAITEKAVPLVKLLIAAGADVNVVGRAHSPSAAPLRALAVAESYAASSTPYDLASPDPYVARMARELADAAEIVALLRAAGAV